MGIAFGKMARQRIQGVLILVNGIDLTFRLNRRVRGRGKDAIAAADVCPDAACGCNAGSQQGAGS
jgi:hypothetical protein